MPNLNTQNPLGLIRKISLTLILWFTIGLLSLSQAATITYHHFDALGSPVASTDEAGQVVWREAYQPFGTRLRKETQDNTLWYTGKPTEEFYRVSYFGARWYNPEMGRFMAMDPVGVQEGNIHSFNRYTYGNNNPYRFIDPDGRYGAAIAYGAVEASLTVLDGYSTYQVLQDPNSSGFDKYMSASLTVMGAVAPLGGYSTAATKLKGYFFGKSAADKIDPKILQSRQRRSEMTPKKTKKFTKQMQQDGYNDFPKIDAYDVDGDLIIKDGHHRARAAVNAGVNEVPINKIPVTDEAMKQTLRKQVFDAKTN